MNTFGLSNGPSCWRVAIVSYILPDGRAGVAKVGGGRNRAVGGAGGGKAERAGKRAFHSLIPPPREFVRFAARCRVACRPPAVIPNERGSEGPRGGEASPHHEIPRGGATSG